MVTENPNIISKEMTKIESVTGSHDSGKSNDDVLGFHAYSYSKIINYFPSGLDLIFKNIKLISTEKVKLKEIHQSDLKPFQQLEFLCLAQNDITTLEKDLFKFNPNLILVMLYSCRISHIDPNVFDNLHKLTYLLLESNACIHEEARDDSREVAAIVKRIQNRQCFKQEFETPKIQEIENVVKNDTTSTTDESVPTLRDLKLPESNRTDTCNISSLNNSQCQAIEKNILKNIENIIETNNNSTEKMDFCMKNLVENVKNLKTTSIRKIEIIDNDLRSAHFEILKALQTKSDEIEKKILDMEERINKKLDNILRVLDRV
jgi:hypothetical protein